jgi:hypothetical protein
MEVSQGGVMGLFDSIKKDTREMIDYVALKVSSELPPLVRRCAETAPEGLAGHELVIRISLEKKQ